MLRDGGATFPVQITNLLVKSFAAGSFESARAALGLLADAIGRRHKVISHASLVWKQHAQRCFHPLMRLLQHLEKVQKQQQQHHHHVRPSKTRTLSVKPCWQSGNTTKLDDFPKRFMYA
jgi:hypothetical protein